MNADPVVVAIVFSDLVIREQGTGKCSLIGCFNQWNIQYFPFALPTFYATVMLTNFRGKFNKPLNITVRIEDPQNGHVLHSMSGNVNAPPEFDFTGHEVVDIPFPVASFSIPKSGVYSAVILANNEKIGSRTISVNAITANTQPPQQLQ